jgi:hypothetical protein
MSNLQKLCKQQEASIAYFKNIIKGQCAREADLQTALSDALKKLSEANDDIERANHDRDIWESHFNALVQAMR